MGVPVSIEVGYEAGPTGFGLNEKGDIRGHVIRVARTSRRRASRRRATAIAGRYCAGVRTLISLKESGKATNVAKAECARKLACFIWGMMTGNYYSASFAST